MPIDIVLLQGGRFFFSKIVISKYHSISPCQHQTLKLCSFIQSTLNNSAGHEEKNGSCPSTFGGKWRRYGCLQKRFFICQLPREGTVKFHLHNCAINGALPLKGKVQKSKNYSCCWNVKIPLVTRPCFAMSNSLDSPSYFPCV